jgi:hypothetical protein
VENDAATLYWIYKETKSRLETLSCRVSEGRDVLAASEFARWLSFSGIIKLLESNPQPEPLKVDGAFLRWNTEQLIQQCNERFRTNSVDPNFKAADFKSLHDKVDTIAGYLSTLASTAEFNALAVSRQQTETSESINESVIHSPVDEAVPVQPDSSQSDRLRVVHGGLQ